MVETKKGIMGKFHNLLNKRYESLDPSFEIDRAVYYKEDGVVEIFLTPKYRKYIKGIEVTVRDYNLRDLVKKLKKINGQFKLSYSIDPEKNYKFSFYSMGKDGKFSRIDYDVEDIKKKMAIVSSEATNVTVAEGSGKSGKKEKVKSNSAPAPVFIPVKRSWPTSSQYSQSLQNPGFSLSKNYEELKGIAFEKNQNVKYSSIIQGAGNFGVVFKYNSTAGDFALKCFTRGSPNIQLRYYEVSKKINDSKIPFLLDFKFYENALRVTQRPKEYFPAVTMRWIEGKTLHNYIKENLSNPAIFKSLGNKFVSSIREMQNNSMAHGDLSCDNILIDVNANLKLIDYDGMYVPALRQLGSEELGHESFQHPKRGRYYGEKLDNFSVLIIYTSLMAISKNPSFWKFNGDDPDKLLFDINDFESPGHSKVFKQLQSESPGLKKLSKMIIDFLNQTPDWPGFDPSNLVKMK